MTKKASNKRKKERKKKEQQRKIEIQNRRNKFITLIDRSIPEYPQIINWDITPTPPFKVDEIDISRCFYLSIIIKDSNNIKYTFGFDLDNRLIYAGELFYSWEGMGFTENRFAYIIVNSQFEKEIFLAIESAIEYELEKGKEEKYMFEFKEYLKQVKIVRKKQSQTITTGRLRASPK